MNNVFHIVQELREAKGSNAKKEILNREAGNTNLSFFLWIVYEPSINYYMTKLPKEVVAGRKEPIPEGQRLDILKDIYEKLSMRTVTGLAAKEFVKNSAMMLDEEGVELLRIMIARDIKAGVGPSTINNSFKDLITVVPYMRCVLPKDSDVAKWPWGTDDSYALSQTKADGEYAAISSTQEGLVKIKSRAGSIYPESSAFNEIRKVISLTFENMGRKSMEFNGELLVYRNGVKLPREEGNGLLNSILQTGVDLPAGVTVHYVVWDCLPVEEAKTKAEYQVPYKERFEQLSNLFPTNRPELPVSVIKTKKVKTIEEANAHLQEEIAAGEEGTVLKHMNGPWIDGDSKFQVKGKIEAEIDVAITGFVAGDEDGRNSGTFGSLSVSTDDTLMQFNVTGLTDDMRKMLNDNREFYTGKIITVCINNIMFSKDGGKTPHSAFLPRFRAIRLDKVKANTFQEVCDIFEASKKKVFI